MSGQDPPPQAPRRKKKLVLRKIAVEGGGSVPDTWSNSYTGPLPAVRPPPRLSSPMILVGPADDAEPEIISEVAIESTVIVSRSPSPSPSPGAWAAAAMTAAAPDSTGVATARSPSFLAERVEVPAPARPSDGASRTTVAPVVATLTPMEMSEPLPSFRLARLSLDSKVLAAGGAVAIAMLLVALGVVLGVHSGHPADATTTAARSSVPLAVEARAAGSIPTAPLAAIDMPPPAAPANLLATSDSKGASTIVVVEAPRPEILATVDVSQLPTARAPRGRWMPAATKAAGATGWTVAAPVAVAGSPAAVERAAPPATQIDTTGEDAPAVEIPAAAAPPPVDPLVQAVREDIREDEAHTK